MTPVSPVLGLAVFLGQQGALAPGLHSHPTCSTDVHTCATVLTRDLWPDTRRGLETFPRVSYSRPSLGRPTSAQPVES